MRSSQFFQNRLRASPHVCVDKTLPGFNFAPMYTWTKTSQAWFRSHVYIDKNLPKLGFAPIFV
jgi:hypothetical protein